MVNDRLASARSLLANQMAADIVAREQRSLTAERDALQAQLADQKKKVNELNKTIEKKDAQIEELQGEIARINHLLDKLKDIEAEARASREADIEAARKLLEDAEAKRDAEETDETVAAIRAEADEILNSPDGGVQKQEDEANAEAEETDKPVIDEALRAKAEGAKDEVTITPIPTPGKRYCVRPGDTYSALAREAYGSAVVGHPRRKSFDYQSQRCVARWRNHSDSLILLDFRNGRTPCARLLSQLKNNAPF